ncbi:hypothetical protein THRCLA_09199 [Thraustotheca clavata]|uniref:WRKY19-like zinc finger domain-containing protein n=1 Tax=Thraustotheca clavata TaxID=74557 RepID=A0A1V9YYM3_9STRA|nr:hypothetical protein THRCLA_09199 [Thraustotheca clavata]
MSSSVVALHQEWQTSSPKSVVEMAFHEVIVGFPRLPSFDMLFKNHSMPTSFKCVPEPRRLPSLKDILTKEDGRHVKRNDGGIKLCSMYGCAKRAKAGGVCIAHGGGIRCAKDGCTKHAVSMGHCISHGGGKRCTVYGCHNASRKYGVCWSHGGKRSCLKDGCTKGPKTGGYCWAHGGKTIKK